MLNKFLFFLLILSLVFQGSSCQDDVCSLPLVAPGNCRAAITRYGYDQSIKKCKKFIYGGCGGNRNSFEFLEQCQAACETSWTTDGPDGC